MLVIVKNFSISCTLQNFFEVFYSMVIHELSRAFQNLATLLYPSVGTQEIFNLSWRLIFFCGLGFENSKDKATEFQEPWFLNGLYGLKFLSVYIKTISLDFHLMACSYWMTEYLHWKNTYSLMLWLKCVVFHHRSWQSRFYNKTWKKPNKKQKTNVKVFHVLFHVYKISSSFPRDTH